MLYIVDTIISPIFHGEIIEAQRLQELLQMTLFVDMF